MKNHNISRRSVIPRARFYCRNPALLKTHLLDHCVQLESDTITLYISSAFGDIIVGEYYANDRYTRVGADFA